VDWENSIVVLGLHLVVKNVISLCISRLRVYGCILCNMGECVA